MSNVMKRDGYPKSVVPALSIVESSQRTDSKSFVLGRLEPDLAVIVPPRAHLMEIKPQFLQSRSYQVGDRRFPL